MAERGECPNCGSPKNDGRCPNCIITGVLLELKKPLNEDWEEFGQQLRGLRSLSHRLLNSGMLGLVTDLHNFEERKRNGKTAPDEKPKLYSYPHICAERDAYASWARERARQVREAASTANYSAQKARSEAKKAEALKDVAKHETEATKLESRVALAESIPGDVLAYANYITDKKFRQWLKVRAEDRLPMFKKKSPIFLPPVACKIVEVEKTSVHLSLKLRGKGRVEVAAIPVSGSAWQSMRWISSGEAKPGDCKISYDERKKKWFARITVTRPRPEAPAVKSGVVLAVNRGRNNFLYAVANDGRGGNVIWPGSDILHFKQQIRARGAQLKSMRHHRGSGARGHGRERFFKAETMLDKKEANFVHTVCQQAAAELNRRATMIGAGTIVIEDFSTIENEDLRYIERWPWAQLKSAIAWMCEKTGRTLVEVPSEYISSECPRCKNLDVTQASLTGTFHCKSCGYERANDFVACYSMLNRTDADMTAWHKAFKDSKKFTTRLAAVSG
jgi:IS605 OrfB family transposase